MRRVTENASEMEEEWEVRDVNRENRSRPFQGLKGKRKD